MWARCLVQAAGPRASSGPGPTGSAALGLAGDSRHEILLSWLLKAGGVQCWVAGEEGPGPDRGGWASRAHKQLQANT